MAVKRVGIVYATGYNPEAMRFIAQNLEGIFGEYVRFTDYYLDEFDPCTRLDEDAYLVSSDASFQTLKAHVSDQAVIIMMKRCMAGDALAKLEKIPPGSAVLVVNDDLSSSMETVASFNELGVRHIVMTPYDAAQLSSGIYDHFTIAVTPHEVDMVPPHIRQIIDVGYRPVGFDTFYSLMTLLNLDIDIINRNLFRHIQTIIEPSTASHDNYIDGYLKGEMLDHVANQNRFGMILVDQQYRTVYANNKALAIFRVSEAARLNLRDFIPAGILESNETLTHTVSIRNEAYTYDKFPFMLVDEIAGYYIALLDKSPLADYNRQMTQNGYIAKYHFRDIIHHSACMDTLLTKARQIATSDHTVLIRGESGTGKELLAQSIHNASYRNKSPFIAINCASLPESLLESELFGYEKGAFTGAKDSGRIGLFEQANHGTLFLDEIGDLSAKMQSHLLRAIQEKQIMRLGGDRLISIDTRLIAATNKDLEAAVAEGSFRGDLFFRLNVFPLVIPPLRNRKEDIPFLMEYFLGSIYRSITSAELHILQGYDWPGNVRELENVAAYYQAFTGLPDYLLQLAQQMRKQSLPAEFRQGDIPVDTLEEKLLLLIAGGTSIAHGVGRNTMLHGLKQQGFPVSDGHLRHLLTDLKDRGLITIGRGREGTMITAAGKNALDHNPIKPH